VDEMLVGGDPTVGSEDQREDGDECEGSHDISKLM